MTTDVPISDEMVEAGAKSLLEDDPVVKRPWQHTPKWQRDAAMSSARSMLSAALAHYQDPRVDELAVKAAKIESQLAALREALEGGPEAVMRSFTEACQRYTNDDDLAGKNADLVEAWVQKAKEALSSTAQEAKDHDARVRAEALEEAAEIAAGSARIAWDTGDAEGHEILADVAQAIRSLSNQEGN